MGVILSGRGRKVQGPCPIPCARRCFPMEVDYLGAWELRRFCGEVGVKKCQYLLTKHGAKGRLLYSSFWS